MNKVIPVSIITCDCCASTGFIRTCKLKNCDYKMCLKCRRKYYIEGQHLQCPACRRNINNGYNRIFFLPTYLKLVFKTIYRNLKKIKSSIHHQMRDVDCEPFCTCLFKFIVFICQLSYIFCVLCIFRFVYHLHCNLFIFESCTDDFLSEMFIIYVVIGIFISFVYCCMLGCVYTCVCGNNDEYDDFY